MAYSPLWQGRAAGRLLPIRPDALGLLEVELPAGTATVVELTHAPGAAERSGIALTTVSGLALVAVSLRRRARR
jgi:hypothetical protein